MNPDIPGKYIHKKTASNYLELKPDGNYFLFEGSAGVTGTYEVNGSEITIFGDDSTSRATIQDGVITDNEGDQWIRAKAAVEAAPNYTKCSNCNSEVLKTVKFCSNCGAEVSAAGEVRPIAMNRNVRVAAPAVPDEAKKSTKDSTADSEETLASVTWLPPALRKDDFPWELIEAGCFAVVLVLLLVAAIARRP